MNKSGFPSNQELEDAVALALQQLQGEVKVPDINQRVIEILNLSDEIVNLEDESGCGTKLNYRLR